MNARIPTKIIVFYVVLCHTLYQHGSISLWAAFEAAGLILFLCDEIACCPDRDRMQQQAAC